MDAYEATRVVYSRIQALDPENAAKIISLLLVQDHGDKEMIRLAFGPDTLLHSLVLKARKDLGLLTSASSPRLPPLPAAAAAWTLSDGGGYPFCQEVADDTYWGAAGNHQGFLGADHLRGLWRPCLYYERGFCKNGNSCRVLHGEHGGKMDLAVEQDLLLRSRSPRPGSQLAASAFPFSPTGGVPASPASRSMNFLLQQNSSQRAAAAAAMMLAGGEEARRERSDYAGIVNPVSRQIYLTFPADSTFREEDVSNYFSIYGPVQDVRIPYQQKRMFGFVTFVYPETVKLILAKGNPHFVCDARVLVKPYKEKGKVPDKYRNLQQLQVDGLDFSGCLASPTMDGDPYDLQQLGARTMYNGVGGQEMLLRRKLEEQKQAVELQQAIELQGRRFMGLQLMDLKPRSLPSPIGTRYNPNSFFSTHEHSSEHSSSPEDKSPSSDAAASTALSPDRLLSSSSSSRSSNIELLQHPAMEAAAAAAAAVADKDESAGETSSHEDSSEFHESVEHNLPDSPFASPRKAVAAFAGDAFSTDSSASNSNLVAAFSYHDRRNHFIGAAAASPRLPASSFDMAPCNPGFFQMPRLSAGHGAIGM